jgi:hypothetical protein
MIIQEVIPKEGFILHVVAENGSSGDFDVSPFLGSEAFEPLKIGDEFKKIHNGKYFVEWECGADLSADTIEARWTQN